MCRRPKGGGSCNLAEEDAREAAEGDANILVARPASKVEERVARPVEEVEADLEGEHLQHEHDEASAASLSKDLGGEARHLPHVVPDDQDVRHKRHRLQRAGVKCLRARLEAKKGVAGGMAWRSIDGLGPQGSSV